MNDDNIILNIVSKVTDVGKNIKDVVTQCERFNKVSSAMSNTLNKISSVSSHTTTKLDQLAKSSGKTGKEISDNLNVKPKMDISDYENELSKLSTEYKRLSSQLEQAQDQYKKLGRIDTSSLQGLSGDEYREGFVKLQNSVENAQQEFNMFTIEPLKKQLSNVKTELDNTKQSMNNFVEEGKKLTTLPRTFQDIKNLIVKPDLDLSSLIQNKGQAIKLLNELKETMDKFHDDPIKFNLSETDIARIKDITKETEALRDSFDSVKESAENAESGQKKFNKETSKSSSIINKLKKGLLSLPFKILKGSLSLLSRGFLGFGKKASGSIDGLYNKMKKLGLGLLSVRTAMSLLTKAVSSYLSFDGALQDSITNSWNVLGSLLAPVIELVANLFATATTYVYTFIKALTGIDLVARANAKALQSQAKATGKAAGEAQRGLTAMDEITNLPTEPSAGGGGIEIPHIDVKDIEVSDIFSRIIDAIKRGDWYGVGSIIAEGINRSLENINWTKIQKTARKVGENIADLLNGIVDNLNWTLLGSTIGNGIQTAIDFAYGFVNRFHFAKFGEGLGNGLNGAFKSINWKMLGQTITKGITGVLDIIINFFSSVDWKKLGESIREMFENIDWKDIWNHITKALSEAFGGLEDFLSGLFHIDPNVAKNTIIAIGALALLLNITKKLGNFLDGKGKNMSKSINNLSESIKEAGNKFGKAASKFATATEIIAVLGGLALVIKSITWLFKAFDDSSMATSDAIGLLAIVFVGIAGVFKVLTSSVKDVPISSIVKIVAILGTLSLTFVALAKFIDVFAQSGVSAGAVIGVLLGVFGVLVGLMIAVKALGPGMTEALIPFAAIAGILSVVLLVLSKTLPPILESLGKFIQDIGPTLISILDVIGKSIVNIVHSLGVSLPPIIQSVGDLFTSIFNGVSNVISSVGNVIVKIMNTANSLVSNVLNSILNFINRLGPAVNNFIDNIIRGVTKLINFMVSALEFLVNSTVVAGIKGMIKGINKIPGVNIKGPSEVSFKRFAPKLATGTNEIPEEGIYHLHPGEAVVPKKYNPATGGYDDGADNKQIIDLLVSLNANMLAFSEKEMNIYMNTTKVAEATYDDLQQVGKNRNMSSVMKRS